MTDYEIGYGKPPKLTRFKKGVCPNPFGRGKRSPSFDEQVVSDVLFEPAEFQENGRTKRAPRLEIEIRKLGAAAVRGDVESAAKLLKMHSHAKTNGDSTPLVIMITGGMPRDENGTTSQFESFDGTDLEIRKLYSTIEARSKRSANSGVA